MRDYDVIVIGGGPAGLMAAAAAGEAGARVLLLEKGSKLARKLIISGGGRCNVTNRKPWPELIQHIPANGRFMFGPFARFGSEEIIRFFEELGIRLKEEDDNRMFPVSDRAVSVAEALVGRLRALGVRLRTEAPVDRLLLAGGRCHGVRLRSGEEVQAGAVVVAVGGRSVPKTGSTGDGYDWARAAGHTVTPLYPAEVPLRASDPWIASRTLQGLSLQDVALTLWEPAAKKRLTTQRGDMIFTHFGVSGPAALRCGHYVSVAHMNGPVPLRLTIDLLPDQKPDDVQRSLAALAEREPRRAVKSLVRQQVPERMADLLLALASLSETATGAHLSREQGLALTGLMKALPMTVTGTLPLDEAFVTGGGVDIREVDPKTMASRKTAGLFFAGEVLDIHAHTGGYNITVAFSTGHAAGKAAAAPPDGGEPA